MSTISQSDHPVRSALRITGALGLSLALTIGVLVVASSVVGTWG